MQVLHINSNYLTSRLHENLVERLDENNIKNTIFMPMKTEKNAEIKFESRFNVKNPLTFKHTDRYIFTWKQAKIYNQLLKVIDPSEYQLTHAHTLFTDGNIAYRLKRKYNIPYVVTVRGYTDIDGFFKVRWNLRNRGRKILKEASHIIFLSKIQRTELLNTYIKDNDLKEHIIQQSTIIPNGIDSFWFENEGQPKVIENENNMNIISVGEIFKRKNQLTTIKVAEYLKTKYDVNVNLTFVGKIRDKEYYKKLLFEHKVSVKFHDFVPKEQLIELYRNNDIFILPSFQETFGLVYPEAMSQGLPVIYTKGQGFYEQFNEGYIGYGVDPNNIQDIVERVVDIQHSYNQFSLHAIKGYKKFNWNTLSRKVISIYNNVLK